MGYVAGLGRFGSHHMLITEKGCCGRIGSLITTADLSPSPRPSGEFCLDKNGSECLKCIDNFATGALREEAFDKHKCYELLLENMDVLRRFGDGRCLRQMRLHRPLLLRATR